MQRFGNTKYFLWRLITHLFKIYAQKIFLKDSIKLDSGKNYNVVEYDALFW